METSGGLETTGIILGLYWGYRKEYMGLHIVVILNIGTMEKKMETTCKLGSS